MTVRAAPQTMWREPATTAVGYVLLIGLHLWVTAFLAPLALTWARVSGRTRRGEALPGWLELARFTTGLVPPVAVLLVLVGLRTSDVLLTAGLWFAGAWVLGGLVGTWWGTRERWSVETQRAERVRFLVAAEDAERKDAEARRMALRTAIELALSDERRGRDLASVWTEPDRARRADALLAAVAQRSGSQPQWVPVAGVANDLRWGPGEVALVATSLRARGWTESAWVWTPAQVLAAGLRVVHDEGTGIDRVRLTPEGLLRISP